MMWSILKVDLTLCVFFVCLFVCSALFWYFQDRVHLYSLGTHSIHLADLNLRKSDSLFLLGLNMHTANKQLKVDLIISSNTGILCVAFSVLELILPDWPGAHTDLPASAGAGEVRLVCDVEMRELCQSVMGTTWSTPLYHKKDVFAIDMYVQNYFLKFCASSCHYYIPMSHFILKHCLQRVLSRDALKYHGNEIY